MVNKSNMDSFIEKHSDNITGTLTGFDRLVFRGTLRRLAYVQGMMAYLWAMGVLLKEFSDHVKGVTKQLKEASLAEAKRLFRPIKYLESSSISKEETAQAIAQRDQISEGLVCVLSCVEPCRSYDIQKDPDRRKLVLVPRPRKCLHIYHYSIHPIVGFVGARIQTWFPFSIQICINGREWLARQMDQQGLSYQRQDNCFIWLEDPQKAQELMNSQLQTCWPDLLTDIAQQLNPAHEEIFRNFPIDYYWSVYQSEWATDIMFTNPEELARIYPGLVHHGMTTFQSPDVMRFLGKKIPPTGQIHPAFEKQVITDIKRRQEGVRIKHRLGLNSIKIYDKQGSVLRTETTINDPSDFKVYRPKEGGPEDELDWRNMRKGIADIYRRTQVSQAANNRLLNALSSVEEKTRLQDLTQTLYRPAYLNNKRVRALNPGSPDDFELLQAISRAEFTINGMRNRDLRPLLYPDADASPEQKKRQSAAVTRKIRLLRAHGILSKVPKTHRYHLSDKGRKAVTALLAAFNADTDSLAKTAY